MLGSNHSEMSRKKKGSNGSGRTKSRETVQIQRMNRDGNLPKPKSGGPAPDSPDEAEAWPLRVSATNGKEYITVARDAICCQSCFEPYETAEPRTPCILPCFHTYCRLCLEGWAKKGSAESGGVWSCPTCRAACPTAVKALPLNLQLRLDDCN